jgi:GT2 family glycosyltransferase
MKISIVIVTYNSQRTLGTCLDSVFSQEYGDAEVIVVDNGSQDETRAILENQYPMVRVLKNQSNAGPAAARNQAIGKSQGEWILTLDADACLKEDFFVRLTGDLQSCPSRAGIIVPKILYPDKKTIYALGNRLTFLRRFYDVAKGKEAVARFDRSTDIFGACAATAVYRKSMLAELREKDGFCFDEDLFFMAEDVDLAWRARLLGWQVRFLPGLVSFHPGNDAGLAVFQKNYYSLRNRFVMIFKNDLLLRTVLFSPFFLFYEAFKMAACMINGQAKTYFSALCSAASIIRKKRRFA